MLDGYIVNVFDEVAGSELSADATATATSITVVDLADFNQDPEGGSLQLTDGTNTETLTYTVPSGSTGTINVSALANSYTAGITRVNVLSNGKPIVERWADLRQPDGEDLLRTLVPHQLRLLISTGPRDEDTDEGEHVKAEFEDGDLVIRNVLAQAPTIDGLTLHEDTTGNPSTAEKVRWVDSSGVERGYITLYENPPGTFTLDMEAGAGGMSLRHVAVSGGAKDLRVVSATAPTLFIYRQDGTSDFEFDTSGGWQNWAPTLAGWSANPTGTVYRYKQEGKKVTLAIRQATNGTSNATTKTIDLPVTAATITNMQWEAPCKAVDNGTLLTTSALAQINSGGTTVAFFKDWAGTAWTASGGHRIGSCLLVYEAA